MRLAQISGINSPSTVFTSSNYGTLLGDLVSRFLIYAIPAAGFYFFVRLVSSGFSYMTSMGDPGKLAAAQKQLTNALIGLIIVFSAYFIAQIISTIFGLTIL